MKRYFLVLLAFILGAMGLIQGSVSFVSAQEELYTLEEITVTAEKRAVNLQDLARSIAVISADDLDIRSASSVQDVLSSSSNISIQGFQNQIFMRGVGPAGSIMNDPGAEPSVQFNVDGNLGMMSGGANAVKSSMNDVARIEIVRGPAGAVNGRMAAAGTVNVITKDPSFDKLDGNVGITTGDYNTMNTSAALNLPLKLTGLDLPAYIENLSFRIAVRQDKHSSYVYNSSGQDVGGRGGGMQSALDFHTNRIKMKWQPIESLTVAAQYNYSWSKGGQGNLVPPINGIITFPPNPNQPHPDAPWEYALGPAQSTAAGATNTTQQYSDSVEVTWATKFGTLDARYGKSWVPQKCGATGGGGGPPPPGGSNVCYEGDVYQIEREVRFNSLDDAKIKWMVGAYKYYKKEYAGPAAQFSAIDPAMTDILFANFYGNANYFMQGGNDISLPTFQANNPPTGSWVLPGMDPVTADSAVIVSNSGTRPITSYSYYGNITYPFLENKHRLTLGLRKTIEDKKRLSVVGIFKFDNTNGGLPHFTYKTSTKSWVCDNCYLADSEAPQELKIKNNPLSYTLGYEYDWKPEVLLYANINNGFKPGGISPGSIPNQTYEPETLTNFAVGMRSRWFNNSLQLNVEAYLMAYDNLQLNLNSERSVDYTLNGVTYTQPFAWQAKVMNVGKTNITGVDIDYDWLISTKDRLEGNLAFKDAKYGALIYRLGAGGAPPGHPEYADFKGRQMPQAPKFSFTANYSHQFSLGNYMLTPRFDVKYSSKFVVFDGYWWEACGAEVNQPSYWKYNAYLNIGPEDGSWQLNAYMKNINKAVIRTVAFMDMYIEDPRTVGLGLSVKF